MKKLLSLTLVLIMALTVFVSCQPQNVNGYLTVVVGGDEEFEVDLDKVEITEGALSVLEYLKNEGKLDYTASEGAYGAFLTKVGDVEENAAEGKYVGIWTSVAKDFDTSAYATTKEYKGTTLTSAGVGISQLTLTDGAVIYIDYIIYE